jgi:indolepyruvate ferredoxin oxidoreductase
VATNQLALSLGRLAAADPAALTAWREPSTDEDVVTESLAALIGRARVHLSAWQNAAWADRFERCVRGAQAREQALNDDPALPFTQAVARSLFKLMSYDETGRGVHRRQLSARFARPVRGVAAGS